MKTSPSRSAFTLLELAIVLAILAVLTHLAVVKLDNGTFKPAQARRQIDDIGRAVFGFPGALDPAGQPTWTGFVADMGRSPRAVPDASGAPSLSELWRAPADSAFAVRSATAENLAPGSNPSDADPQINLPCGWNGPYYTPAHGADRLLDPWGNPYALEKDSGEPVAEGDDITFIVSLGSDGARGWDRRTESAKDIEVLNTAGAASLSVIPTFRTETVSSNGVATLEADMTPLPTRLRVYSPSGARIAVASTPLAPLSSGGALQIDGLSPGPRVFRIERDGVRGTIHPVVLRPGANVVNLPANW